MIVQNAAGMLIFGAIILAIAVGVDSYFAEKKRSRMDEWRRKRDGGDKK